MRREWLLFLLVSMGASASAVQIGDHPNSLEPAVKTDLQIPTDVILTNCMIRAGVYVVMCDRETVTFVLKSNGEKVVSLPCRGPIMKEKSKDTRAVYEKQPSGYIVLDKLYLKGNNVEHVF